MAVKTVEAKISATSLIVDPKDKDKKIPNPHAGQSMSVKYDFGGTLGGLVDKILNGNKELTQDKAEDVAYSNAEANGTVTLQSLVRRCINSGKTSEQTQAEADKWVMGVASSRSKLSTAEKVGRAVGDNASVDDLDATIKMLEDQRAALEEGE